MPDGHTDDDPQLMEEINESIEDVGIIRTALCGGSLLALAVVILLPETLRLMWCKITGKQYRSPAQRIVEQTAEVPNEIE